MSKMYRIRVCYYLTKHEVVIRDITRKIVPNTGDIICLDMKRLKVIERFFNFDDDEIDQAFDVHLTCEW